MYSDAERYDENAILRILKWLSNKTTTLHQTLQESILQDKDCSPFSDAQLLVMLLRALGLRVRLVMVLNPIPFKESKASSKTKSAEGSEKTVVACQEKEQSEEQMEVTVEPDVPSGKETKSSGKRKRKGSREKLQSKSESGGEKAGGGGTSKTISGSTGKKIRQCTDEGSSSSRTLSGQAQKGGARKRTQTTKQQKELAPSTSSPYFKKQTRCRSARTSSSQDMEEEEDPGNLEQPTSKRSSGSDSEYVPEGVKPKKRNLSTSFEEIGAVDDDDDDDFEQPKKKQRRSSSKLVGATPAKKLKQAADKKAKAEIPSKPLKSSSRAATSRRKPRLTTSASKNGSSNQAEEGGSKSPVALDGGTDSNLTAASNYDSNQSRGSSLESVEIVKSEETACWAEVYLTVAGRGGTEKRGSKGDGESSKEKAKRWTCVHLPSCSVGQPHLCEKHCTLPLHYVIAIENGR